LRRCPTHTHTHTHTLTHTNTNTHTHTHIPELRVLNHAALASASSRNSKKKVNARVKLL
jgi:hypothetical protein